MRAVSILPPSYAAFSFSNPIRCGSTPARIACPRKRTRKGQGLHRYDFVFLLKPSGLFGLPDEGWTIIGNGARDVTSPVVDARTENFVGHGTLSQYRLHEDRLVATLTLNAIRFEVDDNFLRVAIEAIDRPAAQAVVHETLTRYCAFASGMLGTFLSFEVVQILEDDEPLSIPLRMTVMNVRMYNLGMLREKLTEAGSLLDGLPPDQTLDQALRYFSEAGILYNLLADDTLEKLLRPLCFLQFWKALATIVGDPSSGGDHQSRYRRFGLGAGDKGYYNRVLSPLHFVRNQFDVAHVASLNTPAFVRPSDVEQCRSVANDAIQAYVIYLRQTSHTDSDEGGS